MIRLVLFVAGTVALVAVSSRSLARPRSHGFPRFFSWVAILALILLNVPVWFHRPWRPAQLVSWALLIVSVVLVLYGAGLLKSVGHPAPRPDPQPTATPAAADHTAATADRTPATANSDANFGFENTTVLVDTSIYRFVRHPLYGSLLALAWGVFAKRPSIPGALLAAFATGCLFATAIIEERENLAAFGPRYADYMRRTKRFIPFVI
jgi:hypothetical protein